MSQAHMFGYVPDGGEPVLVGEWRPQGWPRGPGDTAELHITRDRDEAELWRAELAAGRLPETAGAPADGPPAPTYA